MSTVVSHKYKFIFVHVPKTSGSAFMTRFSPLWKYLGEDDVVLGGHIPYDEIKFTYPNEWQDYFKITFVRNPWDRMVSLWILRGGRSTFLNFLKRSQKLRKPGPKMLRPQSFYIGDGSEFDFIGRFENYQPSVYYVMGRVGLPLKVLKQVRITPNRTQDYAPHYTLGCRRIVTSMYKDDVKNFGYKFKQ